MVSLNFFATPVARIVPCGNLFEIVASKVFLAVPSDCPLGPDGKARAVPSRSIAGRTVTLYVSDWDGDDFTEVCLPSNLEDDGEGDIDSDRGKEGRKLGKGGEDSRLGTGRGVRGEATLPRFPSHRKQMRRLPACLLLPHFQSVASPSTRP